MKNLPSGRITDLFAAAGPRPPINPDHRPYGPPESVMSIPQPWGGHHYRIRRSAILKCEDADDGRSWLTVAKVPEPILVGVSVESVRKAMPTLAIGGKR